MATRRHLNLGAIMAPNILPWLGLAGGALLGAAAVLISAHHMVGLRPVDRLLIALLLSLLGGGVGWLVGAGIAAGAASRVQQ